MSLVPLVHLLTSFLNVLGQSWGAAAEHTHFTHLQTWRNKWLKSQFVSCGEDDEDCGHTFGWTSCRELKKDRNGGRPKWVTDLRPVKRLRFHTF